MDLGYFELSLAGIRPKNEDTLGYRQPSEPEGWRSHGAVAIIADGVGGQGDGDLASQLAVRTALEAFADAAPGTPPGSLLRQMFSAANLAVYDASMANRAADKRMATTLTASLFRHHEAHIGHIGDCRVYHIHSNTITRVTNDHSYTGMQMKLGLINSQEAANSDLRCILTRSVGREPMIQADIYSIQIEPGDFIVQCCDGVYCCVSEQEILDVVRRRPEQACKELIALVQRRGGDDNLSVQVIQVREVERVTFHRGLPIYEKVTTPSMDQELQIDQILDDRFQIIHQISKSGMATIYKAIDQKTGKPVALKVPFMQFESDPGFYSRFMREEEIGKKLHHPCILHIEETPGLEKSRPYLVMEYLEGQTLGQVMKSLKPMPEADSLRIASRVCDALQYLHDNNVIHRDLKPDNIMICDDGTIRIMDFGIAKVEGARRLTFGKFQPAMGTPDYMSPEQVRGQRGDARTDIYSLGAMLYEMVTGFPPFEGANPLAIMTARLSGDPIAPRKRNPSLSAATEEIILHAMARKPEDRYASSAEMRKDLDYPYEVQITGRADRLTPVSPMKSGLRRYSMAFLAVGVVLVFLLFLLLSKILRVHVELR